MASRERTRLIARWRVVLPRLLASGLLVWAGCTARSADADESPVALVWDAPAPCPGPEVVRAQILRSLSSAMTVREHAVVEAHVTPGERGRWNATLRIETHDGTSERALEAESCEAIASAVALVSVVAIEGGEVPHREAVAPPPPPPPPPAPAQNRSSNAPTHSEALLVVAAATADFGRDFGTMPSLAPGAQAGVGWLVGLGFYRLRLVASGSFFPTQKDTHVQSQSDTGSFDLWTAALHACGTRVFGIAEVGPCLGGELEVMQGTGSGGGPSFTSLPADGSWGAFLFSAFGALHFGRVVALIARGDGVFSPPPPTFRDTNQSKTQVFYSYQPSSVALRATLGLELYYF
jgi:hypothetical protein